MEITILTLFPEMFKGVFDLSIIGRAVKNGIVKINCVNFRDYAPDKHQTVDGTPCGGGVGMVLRPDVIDFAINAIVKDKREDYKIILMTPQGRKFNQGIASELSLEKKKLIFICGHYEGFDERIREFLVDDEISIGDFVLSGGEPAAIAIVDSIVRLLPGALGKDQSSEEESFSIKTEDGTLLEYPIYTRPVDYKGWKVPEVLLLGDHGKIEKWRLEKAKERTEKKRPDLLQ